LRVGGYYPATEPRVYAGNKYPWQSLRGDNMKKEQKVRKVVIPAAGFGTRFLPITKVQPKEMLPVVDKPVIHYVEGDDPVGRG
jgi:hypothetical protein